MHAQFQLSIIKKSVLQDKITAKERKRKWIRENNVYSLLFFLVHTVGIIGQTGRPKNRRLLSWTTKEKEMIFAKNEQQKGIVDLIR